MKRKEFLKELESADLAALKAKSVEKAEEIFKLKIRHASNNLENSDLLKKERRNFARIKTLVNAQKKAQADK